MKKKILQINTVCGVGSTGRIAKDIGQLIEKDDMESYIAYGYGKCSDKNAIKIGTKLEYYTHNLLSRLTGRQGRYSYFATRRFLKKLDKIKPDVIHLHNIHGNYINYPLLFKYINKNQIPIIWTLHDCWSYTGKCVHYDYIKCEKWKNECKNCKQLREYPKSYFFDFSKNEYIKKKDTFTSITNMHIITPSEWLAREVEKSFLQRYPIQVIRNGIDLSKFKKVDSNFRKKYNIEGKFIVLGVASEWTKRKGADTFIELSKALNTNYQIVMVGLTEKQKNNFPDNIIKINKTNSIQELVEIYSSANVFVNPTLEDNFPTTNIEALACGLPVITYNTGGSVEAVNGNCGIIIEKENINQLVDAIENVRKSNMFNSQICIEEAKKYDKWEKFEQYITLYEKI